MGPGGIERTISLLSNMYVRKGDYVWIITLDKNNSFYRISSEVKQIHLGLSRDSKNLVQAIRRNLLSIVSLRKCLNSIRPDVLIAFGASTELVAYIAKAGKPIALVGAERSNPYIQINNFWNRNTCRIARLCDGFLFQTQGAASFYPCNVQKKALIVPNGIDSSTYEQLDRCWEARNGICAVGRMDANKGIDDVIRAFLIVHNKFHDVILDIYGEGPLRNEFEILVDSLALSDYVIFHGSSNAIQETFASHKVFIMMSHCEGFPNSLLEAMASGCVCVASNCNFGPSELIRNGENGFLVPVGDSDAAAKKVLFALQNDTEAMRLSKLAKTVRSVYCMNGIGQKIHDYLTKIC